MADPFDPFDPFPTDTLFEGDDGDDLFASLFGRNDTLIGNGGFKAEGDRYHLYRPLAKVFRGIIKDYSFFA